MGKKRQFITSLTNKGQVTIRLPMSLEEAYGSVAPLGQPQNFEAIQQAAREERAEQWANRLGQ